MSEESVKAAVELPLLVKRVREGAKLPEKAHPDDACYDFFAAEDFVIEPYQTVKVSLGVALGIPGRYSMILKERSGLAAEGIIVGAGVIDSGYRGEVKAVLRYMPPAGLMMDSPTLEFKAGDKICQGKLEWVHHRAIKEVDSLDETERGEAGFGSTGN